ncbi:DUF2867 domain-containing protein [Pseudoprimorskyibacter insulae]|uniref:DUF2867 domain-containing protein n=1 Tax=Pseudoprimorskyibacter insulae TaxID=1695997 RepID=A0A2R8APQ8_9RHOB|nr:DUF2867 domain-containing protein [Pseudoprimorskyibacter insulae]SPF78031.1 hypothetical protein PRI8871_00620 [Pseudoprimorskyibacter insulae]
MSETASHTLGPREALQYYHSRTVILPKSVTALEGWNMVMAKPLPLMATAFRIRDAISARFGVKKISGFSGKRADSVQVGDKLDFFLVEHIDPNLLVMTERDTHLDVMTTISTEGQEFTVTSSVITHNWFGRLYMVPVGIAHRVIVAAMLRRLKTSMEDHTRS